MELSNGKTHLIDANERSFTRCGRGVDHFTVTDDRASVTCGRCLMLTAPARPAPALVRAPGRDALALHIARHVAYGFAPDQEMLASFRATDVYGPGDRA